MCSAWQIEALVWVCVGLSWINAMEGKGQPHPCHDPNPKHGNLQLLSIYIVNTMLEILFVDDLAPL